MYELPIFPLNTVLFPGMPLQLHIFEERYKIMLQDVRRANDTFGVCLIKNGIEANGPVAQPYATGCTARIMRAEPLKEGRFNLTVLGDERFRIFMPGNSAPYLKAFVESAPLHSYQNLQVMRDSRRLQRELSSYLALLTRYAGEELVQEAEGAFNLDLTKARLPEDPMMLIYLAATMLEIPATEKQPLLETNTATELIQRVRRLIRRELTVLPPLMDISPEQARVSAWVN